jgi:hypothetical protein
MPLTKFPDRTTFRTMKGDVTGDIEDRTYDVLKYLNQRIDGTGETSIDSRMDDAEANITALDGRLDTAEPKITAVEGRLDTVEAEVKSMERSIPPDASATGTFKATIFKAPFDATIQEIILVPDADIGQATDFMVLTVNNKGVDGATDTTVVSRNVNSGEGNPIEGFIGADLIGALQDPVTVDEGICLSLEKTTQGNGQTFPGGLVIVKYIQTPATP